MALVRDPRTGQMIEVPDEQVQGTRGLARPPINVGRAIGDIALGALSVPGAAAADLLGYRATQAVGGQVPTETNPRLNAALQRVSTGAEQFGQANVEAFRGLQSAGQQVLGVQPAVAQQPSPPAPAVAAAPAVTAAQAGAPTARGVREQDRANVAQFVESQPGFVGTPTPATTLSPDILAATNQRIQAALNEARGPQLQPAQRGVFNAQNTDLDALAQRAAPTAGLTGLGQFGGQSAQDYLATTRAQDQADTAQRQQQGAEARLGLERSTLQREATQGTGNQRLAARQALNAFEAQQLQATQEAGATERTGLTVAAQQEQARQQAAANVLAAQAQAQGQLGAAQLRGQFGLQEAQTTAQGRIGAAGVTATSPQARLAEARARQLQNQELLLNQAAQAGDIGGTFAAAGLQQPRAADVATNALGQPVGTYDARGRFVPYTPEELRAAQQAFAPTPQ